MASLWVSLLAFCAAASTVLAISPLPSGPTVTLDQGTFIGTTTNGTNQFRGIPFAQPPVGDLRFRPPEPNSPYVGQYNATAFGASCFQQALNLSLPNGLPNQTLGYLETLATSSKLSLGEDCLTINVIAPANTTRNSKLPVVAWIYGGAFETGTSASYDGTILVDRSIALQQPIIYVSLNYRLSGLGFLGGQEVKDAKVGNLGLRDQRLALQWIQKYICEFGGDPGQVTIWGQSAGAISVSIHMLVNGGNNEGLFQAAFMQSGSPQAAGDITLGQGYYDFLVERTNCSSSSDTLECLRTVSYESLTEAINLTPSFFTYQSLDLAWPPRVDGEFITDDPQKLVGQGQVAKIPIVSGDCDDEGTLFSLGQTNVTNDAEFRAYLQEFFLPNATDAEMDKVLKLYPSDVTLGSPYNTGTNNTLTPEFKRMASFLGDFTFQSERRFFLHHLSGKENAWSYLSKRDKSLPILGSAHSSDLPYIYGGKDLADYLINFVTNLDPNGPSVPHWPQYDTSSRQLLTLYDSPVPTNITLDKFREEGIQFVTELLSENPLVMAFLRSLLVAVWIATATVLASPSTQTTYPTVTLDKGTFTGTTANGTNKFLGIPFAHPPVGNLRFRRPEPLGPYTGRHNATAYGLWCPQQATVLSFLSGLPQGTLEALSTIFEAGVTLADGEDCLTLNVIAPDNVGPGSKLPVVVWIYGGDTSAIPSTLIRSYDGTPIVNRSIALQQPVIYVSMNYRLSAFGFLASQEVKEAGVGNLGLWDQRLALQWVQKYICDFGGDPEKVTIWGQSAGSISVSLQMVTNGGNTEGLFRAAFMQSGSPTPTSDITAGQPYYDFLVESTGCSGSSDTLECLRETPYDTLKAAVNKTPSVFSYQSVALVWRPRVDGIFLVDDPQKLLKRGEVARIPFVSGDCDDEGTLFSLTQTNVTTEADLRTYLKAYYFPNATDSQIDDLLTLYPQDVTQGSPYDTGTQNALTPEFKRIASITGDLIFQAPRRYFLQTVSDEQKTWAYLSKRQKSVPILGSFHESDIPNIYGGGDLTDFLIQFVTNLDPNGILGPEWPQYTTSSPQLMTLLGDQVTNNNRTISLDTYRVKQMEFITNLSPEL
ncbi:Alpha/Beta hydrolase fold [Lactarius tabidus]